MTVAIACFATHVTSVAPPINTLVLEHCGHSFMGFVEHSFPLLFMTLIVSYGGAGRRADMQAERGFNNGIHLHLKSSRQVMVGKYSEAKLLN